MNLDFDTDNVMNVLECMEIYTIVQYSGSRSHGWSVLVSVVLFFALHLLSTVRLNRRAVGEGPADFHVTEASECTNHRAVRTHITMAVLFQLFHLIIPLQPAGLA